MTFLPEHRLRRVSLSVEGRETREPPRIQLVNETETLRSVVVEDGMFAYKKIALRRAMPTTRRIGVWCIKKGRLFYNLEDKSVKVSQRG